MYWSSSKYVPFRRELHRYARAATTAAAAATTTKAVSVTLSAATFSANEEEMEPGVKAILEGLV